MFTNLATMKPLFQMLELRDSLFFLGPLTPHQPLRTSMLCSKPLTAVGQALVRGILLAGSILSACDGGEHNRPRGQASGDIHTLPERARIVLHSAEAQRWLPYYEFDLGLNIWVSGCLCVFMCTCVYLCLCVSVCHCVSVCLCACLCLCVHGCLCVCVSACLRACVSAFGETALSAEVAAGARGAATAGLTPTLPPSRSNDQNLAVVRD